MYYCPSIANIRENVKFSKTVSTPIYYAFGKSRNTTLLPDIGQKLLPTGGCSNSRLSDSKVVLSTSCTLWVLHIGMPSSLYPSHI